MGLPRRGVEQLVARRAHNPKVAAFLKALRLVCGDKSQTSLVRSGESKAVVEALFDISKEPQVKKILDELEIDSDDELIIRREILENGKGRARVNGNVVSQSDLQRIGEELVQMHGQSEQLLLRDTRTHAQMLDDYGRHSMSGRVAANQSSKPFFTAERIPLTFQL